jgi:DNA-binding transcriptional regulator YhcF (GntR family)
VESRSPKERKREKNAREKGSRPVQHENPEDGRDEGRRSIEARWGSAIAKSGWTAVPNIFLDKLHTIGLKPRETIVLILLMRYWYEADKPPFPSKKRLADALGVDERTVQRATSALENLRLVEKRQRRLRQPDGRGRPGSNTYTLNALRKTLEPFAREANEERERHAAENEAIRKRKRPRKEDL